MASRDLQQFSVTRISAAQLTVPRWTVAFQVTNSTTGEVLHDYTGANTVTFPTILGQLTNAQQDEFVEMVMAWLIRKRLNLGD